MIKAVMFLSPFAIGVGITSMIYAFSSGLTTFALLDGALVIVNSFLYYINSKKYLSNL